MNSLEQTLENKLHQETREREIQNLFQAGDYEGLLNAAVLLNIAYSQQLTINRWFAKEAADNLGEAWQSSRQGRNC